MKIALIFNKDRPDTLGIYFESAFRKLDCNVVHIWTREAYSIKPEYDIYVRIDHGDYKYDIPSNLNPSLFYAGDVHLPKPFRAIKKVVPKYDFIFCSQYEGYIKLNRKRPGRVVWIPFACDPEIHKMIPIEKVYSIGFVGNDGGIPRKFLLQELRERYPDSFIGKCHHLMMSQIYSKSKIGFNYSINNEINMRIFEVMSCGALLLTNYISNNGFAKLFEDRKHLVVYHNPRELFELIDYYLVHGQERERIAQEGHKLVTSKHTYEDRARSMLDYIQRKLAKNTVN